MISKIHNCYPKLTDTEKKIADTILRNPSDVTRMSVKQLAAAAGAVPSAVIRFCKSVGASGFSELKLRLSSDLGSKAYPHELLPVRESDTSQQVFRKVFASGVHTLEDTVSQIDSRCIETIVHTLQNADRIVFFGVGTSSVIAVDAQYRFAQLGIPTAACTDILFMNVTAANLRSRDVAVGISHSGNTKATVDALRRAKKAGATTVAISSFEQSCLARECDHRIIAFSDSENYPVEAVSARIAHMCIIDALMMSLAVRNYGELYNHIAERNEVLTEIRYKSKKEK